MNVRKLEYKITEDYNGKEILTFLKQNGYSSRTITMLKNNPRGIIIKNKRCTVRKQLKTGDILTINIRNSPKDEENITVVPTKLEFKIIYEDEDIIIVDKPFDMPTHPSKNNYTNTLANGLMYYWQQKNEKYIIRPVNRLDRDTSGLILFAKNAHSASILSTDLKQKKIVRNYYAIVNGKIENLKGKITAPIARENAPGIKRKVDFEKGAKAITNYEVIKQNEKYALVKLNLETGKTHQIRVHMAYIGHSLLGDFLYGKSDDIIKRQALHSYSIDFCHPITGKKIRFETDLPEDMKKIADMI